MSASDAVLALLEAVPHLSVYDGIVPVDTAVKVVQVPLPYVVFSSGLGEDADERLGGRPGLRVTPFSVFYAGKSPEQARWAGDRARTAVSRKRITIAGRESGLIILRESSDMRRDDDYTGPGGEPLFYATDKYIVAV